MPLSEHEQQVLDELERTLLADDPELANTLQAGPKPPVGIYLLGGAGVLLGLGVLVLGTVLEQVLLGTVGFIIMFAAVAYAMTRASRIRADREQEFGLGSATVNANTAQRDRPSQSRENFMARVEERWDRRTSGQ